MATSKTPQNESPYISLEEAAEILQVPVTSATHVDCQFEGKTLTLKKIGVYSRDTAEKIKAGRDQRELEKREKQEAAKEAAAETVERHEPAKGISGVEAALKQAVESGETS